MTKEVTLTTASYTHPAKIRVVGGSFHVQAPYHEELVKEVKWFDRARWDPRRRVWTFPASPRNTWALDAMAGGTSIERFREPPDPEVYDESSVATEGVELRLKQFEMVQWALNKRHCIWAAEMRTGKTLAYLEVILRNPDWLWWVVAPKKVLTALRREMKRWGFDPDSVVMMTYSRMRIMVKKGGYEIPQGLVLDEASKVKGNSQQTKCAVTLAVQMDDAYGEEDTIRILGTGTPQPKNKLDWYFLCEVARPGFLPWGNMHKFKEHIAVLSKEVGLHGNEFWKIIQWKDGSECVTCEGKGHTVVKRRLGGEDLIPCNFCGRTGKVEDTVSDFEWWLSQIVLSVKKSEVIELPEKEFVEIPVKASETMLRVAKALLDQGLSVLEVQQRHRQLSDGFQYVREPVLDDDGNPVTTPAGHEKVNVRVVRGKYNPKMVKVRELLAAHEECGRFVIFASYTAAIDWLCEVAEEEGWKVMRCDKSTDLHATWDHTLSDTDCLELFESGEEKIVIIGHPKSLAYGFDLAASPGFLFYSLDYDGETFMQAIERGHSSRMNMELGCTLYFLQCLPTDRLIYYNLKDKQGEQEITIDNIRELYSW